MKVIKTSLPGVLVIEPDVHQDERGFFLESYQEARYKLEGVDVSFVQDNHSKSVKNTLRGLHAQIKQPQAKLIRVLNGNIWDVAVDVRKGSPTFGKWFGEELSCQNYKQIYIPAGFVHGFAVLSETAEVEYKCSDLYAAGDQLTVRWDDPDLNIPWPIKDPILSAKDAEAKTLKEVDALLPD